MKKLLIVILAILGLNFIAVAGGVGWLYRSGHLDKSRVMQIKDVLFPPDAAPTTQPSIAAASPDSSDGTQRLDALLAKQAGKPVGEQISLLQTTFDTQTLELDRRQRELEDLKRQVDLANVKLDEDRKALEQQQQALATREQQDTKLQTDKGFQDTLALYNAMPTKKVKDIFLTLDESVVEQYLDAMDARKAGKIVAEFKTPSETAFIQRVIERMRQAQASASDGKP
jgi:hypothetical protein